MGLILPHDEPRAVKCTISVVFVKARGIKGSRYDVAAVVKIDTVSGHIYLEGSRPTLPPARLLVVVINIVHFRTDLDNGRLAGLSSIDGDWDRDPCQQRIISKCLALPCHTFL